MFNLENKEEEESVDKGSKKLIIMRKKCQNNYRDVITYYCSLHRTTKYSTYNMSENKLNKLIKIINFKFFIK